MLKILKFENNLTINLLYDILDFINFLVNKLNMHLDKTNWNNWFNKSKIKLMTKFNIKIIIILRYYIFNFNI